MASISAVPANVVFQYVALVYLGNINGARRTARDLGVKKALSLTDGWVELINVTNITARNRRWKISGIEDALKAYQRERFTHFYKDGRAIGAILCRDAQTDFLQKSIENHVFPEDTEIRYL